MAMWQMLVHAWWAPVVTVAVLIAVVAAVHWLLNWWSDRKARQTPEQHAQVLDDTLETLIKLLTNNEQAEQMTLDERNIMIAALVRELHARNRRRPVAEQYDIPYPRHPERPSQ